MSKAKKCYNCMSEAEAHATVCPRCEVKLGPRQPSGIAAKPGSPLFKIFLVVVVLAICGKIAGYTLSGAPAEESVTAAEHGIVRVRPPADGDTIKDVTIRGIKEKGAKELGVVGVTDIGYLDEALCVYVDHRFTGLSGEQQDQLLSIVATEWKRAIGKDQAKVKVLENGTGKVVSERRV